MLLPTFFLSDRSDRKKKMERRFLIIKNFDCLILMFLLLDFRIVKDVKEGAVVANVYEI